MRTRRTFLAALCVALGLLVTAASAVGGNPHASNQQGNAPGVKPSNSTGKHTECSTGGGQGTSATCTADNSSTSSNGDASKRYGNGKTAAQIANDRGAPAGTQIKGPGNSQPHKVCRNGHWVDVHAVKSYGSSTSCGTTTSPASGKQPGTSGSTSSPSSTSAGSNASVGSNTGVAPGTSNSGGVLGASRTRPATPSAPAAHGGVLGARAALRSSTRGSTLPFTGLPLWIPLAAALALLAAGLGLGRRRRPLGSRA